MKITWVFSNLPVETLGVRNRVNSGPLCVFKIIQFLPTTLWICKSSTSTQQSNVIPRCRQIWVFCDSTASPTKSQKLSANPSSKRNHHCDAFKYALVASVDSRDTHLPSSQPLELMGSSEEFISRNLRHPHHRKKLSYEILRCFTWIPTPVRNAKHKN